MKKKSLVIAGGVFIVVVLAVVIAFVIIGGNNTSALEVDLNGTWCVYQYAENKIDNEFMVFNEGVVSDFRDGKEDPYITSSYTYENGTLVMAEISKEFTVRVISDNNIILVEPDTREWKMIKVSNGDRDIKELTPADLIGEYTVVSVAGEPRENEVMTFSDTKITDTRNDEEYLASQYELTSGHSLILNDISKEFYVYKNANAMLLIDKVDGYVWELIEK